MTRPVGSGRGYWATQIAFAAVLAVLGLGGGIWSLSAGPPNSLEPGETLLMLLTGTVFLALLVWLLAQVIGSSREKRAVYAWAIMQQHHAADGAGRVPPTYRAVRGDVESLRIAALARDGLLPDAEIERLQALRPDVPYPGRRPAAASRIVSPKLRAARAADDAAAAELLEPLAARRRLARIAARTATAAGAGLIVAFLLDVLTPLRIAGSALFVWLLIAWLVLSAVRGACEDALTRAGRRVAEHWMADAERAARGLPSPFQVPVGTPLGACVLRVAWPLGVIGFLLVFGGIGNLPDAGADHAVFVGMSVAGGALLLIGVVVWAVGTRLRRNRAELVRALRDPRASGDPAW